MSSFKLSDGYPGIVSVNDTKVFELRSNTEATKLKIKLVGTDDEIKIKRKHLPAFLKMLQNVENLSFLEKIGKLRFETMFHRKYCAVYKDDDVLYSAYLVDRSDEYKIYSSGSYSTLYLTISQYELLIETIDYIINEVMA